MAIVKFLPRAVKDFLALSFETQSEILNKAELLQNFPLIGRAMERAYSGYRCLLAGKNRYRIIYKTKNQDVEIAYIRHCRRQMTLRMIQ